MNDELTRIDPKHPVVLSPQFGREYLLVLDDMGEGIRRMVVMKDFLAVEGLAMQRLMACPLVSCSPRFAGRLGVLGPIGRAEAHVCGQDQQIQLAPR